MNIENLTYNECYDLHSLCKAIKSLQKKGFQNIDGFLPFETAKSRFVEGNYLIVNVIGETKVIAKQKLDDLVITDNQQLVHSLEKNGEHGFELVGIVHVTKHK